MASCFLLKRSVVTKVLGLLLATLLLSKAGMSQTIEYTGKDVPVEKLIGIIKQQTGYSVMYNPDLISKAKPVTIEAHNMPLTEFLHKILAENILVYTIENKTIFIKKGVDHSKMDHSKMDHSAGGMTMMRIFNVRGKVTGADGEPMQGVAISQDKSPYGIITDANGNFELRDVKKITTLSFNLLGYEKAMVSVAACCTDGSVLPQGVTASVADDNVTMTVNVSLKQDVKALEEIAVANTGYQTVTRERATGAYATVSNEQLNAHLNTSLSSALEGKVAGLSMYRNSAIIRGVSTFSSSTQVGTDPLLVVDNMITEGGTDNINPYDVESVTVLKDAAASSIYGARAANGVIVVVTKKGKKGQVQVTVNADHFITTKPDISKMHYASTSDLIDYETDVYKYQVAKAGSVASFFSTYGSINNGTIKYYSPLYALYRKQSEGTVSGSKVDSTLSQWRQNDYINDYTSNVWRNEVRKRYNIAISGGSDKVSTFFSLNYDGNLQRVKNNNSDNFTLYFKNTFNAQKWLSVTVGANARYTDATTTNSAYNDYSIQSRYERILDNNGRRVYADYVKLTDGYSGSDGMNSAVADAIAANSNFKSVKFNVLDELEYNKTRSKSLWLRAFADMKVNFTRSLTYNIMTQYEMARSEAVNEDEAASYTMRYLYNAMTAYNATTNVYTRYIPDANRLYQADTRSRNYTFRQQLGYNNSFTIKGSKHDIVALGGMEAREISQPFATYQLDYGYNPVTTNSVLLDWKTLKETGIASYLFGTTTLGALATTKKQTLHRYLSYYGNFGYTLNGKYNVTGSVRADQTDLFGTDPKYRYRPLWSVGAGWNATNEKFLGQFKWLNYLKVRLTYGIGGNVDKSTSPFITATIKSDNLFTSLQYPNLNTLPNPMLRWEKTATTNIGIDFTVLNNLLSGSIDYYRKYSSDLLVKTDLDPTVGATSQTINNGAMSNRGIELALNSMYVKTKAFTVSSRLTLAFNRNRIEKADRAVSSVYSLISAPNDYYYANTPFSAIYAYQYAGMINGYPYFYDEKGTPNITFDASGAPTSMRAITNVNSAKLMGTYIPKWSGAFQQSFGYKGIELSALVAFYGGHQMRKDVMSIDGFEQTDRSIVNRWKNGNTNVSGPRLEVDYPSAYQSYAGTNSTLYRYSDIQIVSATSFRLRNISLSYTLPAKYCSVIHMKQVRFTAQANNLFLWSAAGNDIDPETFGLNTGSRSLPNPTSYLFGAALTF